MKSYKEQLEEVQKAISDKALLTQGYAVRVVSKFAKKQTSSAPIKTDKSKIKGLNRGL